MEGEEVSYRRWLSFLGSGQAFYEVSYNPYFGADGTIQGFIVNGRDITEQRVAEDALRRRGRVHLGPLHAAGHEPAYRLVR